LTLGPLEWLVVGIEVLLETGFAGDRVGETYIGVFPAFTAAVVGRGLLEICSVMLDLRILSIYLLEFLTPL